MSHLGALVHDAIGERVKFVPAGIGRSWRSAGLPRANFPRQPSVADDCIGKRAVVGRGDLRRDSDTSFRGYRASNGGLHVALKDGDGQTDPYGTFLVGPGIGGYTLPLFEVRGNVHVAPRGDLRAWGDHGLRNRIGIPDCHREAHRFVARVRAEEALRGIHIDLALSGRGNSHVAGGVDPRPTRNAHLGRRLRLPVGDCDRRIDRLHIGPRSGPRGQADARPDDGAPGADRDRAGRGGTGDAGNVADGKKVIDRATHDSGEVFLAVDRGAVDCDVHLHRAAADGRPIQGDGAAAVHPANIRGRNETVGQRPEGDRAGSAHRGVIDIRQQLGSRLEQDRSAGKATGIHPHGSSYCVERARHRREQDRAGVARGLAIFRVARRNDHA